jgi:ArsR family transcriptional regulator
MRDKNLAVFQLHAEICKTLSNPIRLMILNFLRDGEKSVGELAGLVGARQANISQHLAILRQRGIVTTRKQGTSIYYRVSNPKIIRACDLIREVLFEQLSKAKEITEKCARRR